jgi:8-oxo-dGTP pyrophosphatase MutT (NUDIX family)
MYIKSKKLVARAPFLDMVEVEYEFPEKAGKWSGITRNNAPYAVIVAAVTKDRELIFVRQPRAMVGDYTIEFPAGLSDVPGEKPEEVAKREILEETGFLLYNCQVLIGGEKGLTVSSGVSDERVILVVGKDAVKVKEPQQDEATEPILIPLDKAETWLFEKARTEEVDFKTFGITMLVEDWLKGEKR